MEQSDCRTGGGPYRSTAAAFLAILVGIGLSRFAYSPLIPAVIEAGWFTPSQAAYLGAANLAGYLLGALCGQRLASMTSRRRILQSSMLMATAAFVACAVPSSFPWFFAWRFTSGVSGGILMVLAATTALPAVPAHRKGRASGIIFAGVGLGIVLSGTLVPALVSLGVSEAWYTLGGLSLLATCAAWRWWPVERDQKAVTIRSDCRRVPGRALTLIFLTYGLVAIGLVPHMIFLVDFIARGLSQGLEIGGRYWVLFGIGALIGPILAGRLADRFGFSTSLFCALVLQFVYVAVLVLTSDPVILAASSLVIGGAVSGTVPLVLGRTQDLVLDPQARQAAWSTATAVFAIGQAGAGWGLSYLFSETNGDYTVLFAVGAGALAIAILINLDMPVLRRRAITQAHPGTRASATACKPRGDHQ